MPYARKLAQCVKAYNGMAVELVQNGRLEEAVEAFKALISHYEKSEIKHSMSKVYYNLAVIPLPIVKTEN
jgi:TolA-binding protein